MIKYKKVIKASCTSLAFMNSCSHSDLTITRTGSYNMMDEEEQRDRHNRIGMALVFTTGVFEKSALSSLDLIVIGQINKGSSLDCSADMRIKFGALNLKAAKGSMDRYDFSSALTYSQEGLRLLEPDKERWSTNYDLCLGLNETAGVSCFSLALRDKMQSYLLAGTQGAALMHLRSSICNLIPPLQCLKMGDVSTTR